MSDPSGDAPKGAEQDDSRTIADPRQQGLNIPLPPALQSLVDLEKQRIDSFNRRTDVVRYAIETNDAADRRQYEFQMAKLQAESESATRRHKLMQILSIGGGVVFTLCIASLLGMAFLGDSLQSQMALSILKNLGVGTGGYGVITAISALANRIVKESKPR